MCIMVGRAHIATRRAFYRTNLLMLTSRRVGRYSGKSRHYEEVFRVYRKRTQEWRLQPVFLATRVMH